MESVGNKVGDDGRVRETRRRSFTLSTAGERISIEAGRGRFSVQ
jgi:hypothetical protein